jgi:hypothetical protein
LAFFTTAQLSAPPLRAPRLCGEGAGPSTRAQSLTGTAIQKLLQMRIEKTFPASKARLNEGSRLTPRRRGGAESCVLFVEAQNLATDTALQSQVFKVFRLASVCWIDRFGSDCPQDCVSALVVHLNSSREPSAQSAELIRLA